MTRLIYKRTGTDHETALDVEVDSLPGAASQNLFTLISNADFFSLPENLGTPRTLDEPQHIITLEYGGGKQHTVRCADAVVPDSLRPLIEELSALADAQSTR
jgi:hypothetical protein